MSETKNKDKNKAKNVIGHVGSIQNVRCCVFDHALYSDNSRSTCHPNFDLHVFHAVSDDIDMLFSLADSFGLVYLKQYFPTTADDSSGIVYFNDREFYNFLILLLDNTKEIQDDDD